MGPRGRMLVGEAADPMNRVEPLQKTYDLRRAERLLKT